MGRLAPTPTCGIGPLSAAVGLRRRISLSRPGNRAVTPLAPRSRRRLDDHGGFCRRRIVASLGSIDIIVVAQGKIIPSGHSKVIQPLESGVIRAIYVRDGQAVRAGEPLIDLDATATGADKDRLRPEYQSTQVEAARLRAVLKGQRAFVPPPGANRQFVALEQQLLSDQRSEHQARVQAARKLIEQRRAALDGKQADFAGLDKIIPIPTLKADAYKKLLKDQYIAELQWWEAEQLRIERSKKRNALREKLMQGAAAAKEAEENLQGLIAVFQRTCKSELSEIEVKAASLEEDLLKAQQRHGLQNLAAPIAWVVQQVAVHTVGGVVTPAQQLMVIVPQAHQLEVEAMIENKDIGFVKEGQSVEMKIEAFPFTLYGLIDGQVLSVSDDAVPLENGGLVYATRVSMNRSTMRVGDRQIHLSPGMALSMEIKTGQRRLIEFFLSLPLKAMTETAHER